MRGSKRRGAGSRASRTRGARRRRRRRRSSMTDAGDVLSPHQQAVARPWLAAREAERTHVVIYLSGAHAYGFPSPDSDLDLKSVHVAPTRDLVGLEPSEGGR